jgi:hypothetical protein
MCKSPFSIPYLDFDFMLKFFTLAYMPFCKRWWCHSIWGDLTLRVIVIKALMSSKSHWKIIITWIFHGLICNMIKLKVGWWMHFSSFVLKGLFLALNREGRKGVLKLLKNFSLLKDLFLWWIEVCLKGQIFFSLILQKWYLKKKCNH